MTGNTVRYREERNKKDQIPKEQKKRYRSVRVRGVSEQGMAAAVPKQKSASRSKGCMLIPD